jgi:hypothetical protein
MAELARRIVTAGGEQRALLRERHDDPCPRPENRKPAVERRDEDRGKPLAKPHSLQRDALHNRRGKASHRICARTSGHPNSGAAAEHPNRSPEFDTDEHTDSSADRDTDEHTDRDANEHTDSSADHGTNEHADSSADHDTDQHTDASADDDTDDETRGDTHANADKEADGHGNADEATDSHADPDTNAKTHEDTNSNTDEETHGDADANTDKEAGGHGNADEATDSHADTDANAEADEDADGDANAEANQDADTNTDEETYRDRDAERERIGGRLHALGQSPVAVAYVRTMRQNLFVRRSFTETAARSGPSPHVEIFDTFYPTDNLRLGTIPRSW